MYTTLKIAAVAVLALAVVIAIDPLRESGPYAGGPSPSPTPSPTSLLDLPEGTALGAGSTYVLDYGTTTPSVYPLITFTVPAEGWSHWGSGNLGKIGRNPFVTAWSATNLVKDPCHGLTGGKFDPPVGPSIEDLAAGLVQQGAGTASTPTDATVGGFPAKRIELSLPAELDMATCEGDSQSTGFVRWTEGNYFGGHIMGEGQRNVLYIIDVDGFRLLMDTVYLPGTTEADLTEAQQIIDSMRFEPVAPMPSPGSSPAT
jgi:hypothetical protein